MGRRASVVATRGDTPTSAAVYLLAIGETDRGADEEIVAAARRGASSRTEAASTTTIQNVITTSVTAKWLSQTCNGKSATHSPTSVAASSRAVEFQAEPERRQGPSPLRSARRSSARPGSLPRLGHDAERVSAPLAIAIR